jgi:dipeptidyl aminopeptidase/acylaminoacyl peptidase
MFSISPSGERIAYREKTSTSDMVIVINMDDWTLAGGVDISAVNPNNMYFISDEQLIFVASKNRRIRGYSGRHNISAALAYNLKTKKIHQLLVPGKGIYKGQSAIGRITGISKDLKYAYMPAYANPGQYSLFRVRLDKKSMPKLEQRGTSDVIDFFLDANNEVIVRERFNNEKNLHRVEAKVDGDWVDIFSQETPYPTRSFAGLTPDRESLVMLSQDKNHGRWAYYTMSLLDGSIEGPIFSHADKDIENVLTDLDRVVHGVKYSGFTPSYEFFDKKLNARMKGIKKVMPDNNFTIVDYTPDWKQMIFYVDGAESSGDYVLYENGSLQAMAPARPDIPADQVHPVVEYSYKARDGLNIPTLLTVPKNKEIKNMPAIMLPHGGPESYDKKGFNYQAQFFASQGYIVIQPQFRGSDGFGNKHLFAGRGEWGRKMQDDLTDAVIHFANAGVIDQERVCIVGSSYGGYAALAGASFTPDLYKCAVSINGVSDVEEMLKTEEKENGDEHWVVAYWQEVISRGEVDKDHLAKISPVNHVENIKSPVLLIHGEYDKVVPIEQSQNMYELMKDENKKVTFIELDEGDHNLSQAENRMKAMLAIEKFIKEHI